MFKYKKILIFSSIFSICIAFSPLRKVSAEDDVFSSLKENYKTQAANYGKLGEDNVDPGYKTYLNNIAVSSDILASELKDFNNYTYENIPAYEKIQSEYLQAVQSKTDVSSKAAETYQITKNEALKQLNSTAKNQEDSYSSFASSLNDLKAELTNKKSSITSSAKEAATKRYNSVASGYSDAVSKVNSQQISSGDFTKLTDYKSEYKNAVAKLQNQYKDYSANKNIAINKDKSNPVSSTIYSGCTTGAKKANTSLTDKQIAEYCKKESTIYQKPW